MVIDLTQDSDSEEQTQRKTDELLSLFINRPSVARKRKSEISSAESSVTSSEFSTARQFKNEKNQTPSAVSEHRAFSVVIPASPALSDRDSGSPQGKKQRRSLLPDPQPQFNGKKLDGAKLSKISPGSNRTTELTGLSTTFYPTNAHEIRASRGAYPKARQVNREDVSLNFDKPGSHLTKKRRKSSVSVHRLLPEILQNKLATIKGPPVTIVLGPDSNRAPFASNFEFINTYKIQCGVQKVDESFNSGCACGRICDPRKCTCLSQEVDSDDRIIPYQRLSDGLLVLTPDFLKRTSMIYECTSLCSCSQDCWNRVVQRGRTVRLEIFFTGDRGFDPIRAGQFIDCYLGEVITKETADKREEAYGSKSGLSYLFSLDFLVDDDDIYVVDGQKMGSPTRFMNHSCNPNCKMIPVSRHHGDDRLYDLAFFSLRDIPPMTELTFDYNPGWEPRKIEPNAVKCLCGERNCRGQLWPNQRKTSGTRRDDD
ncbi:histone-lysine n-methyltransferase, suv9 [Thermoascus aurantiacus ATCC 26904]